MQEKSCSLKIPAPWFPIHVSTSTIFRTILMFPVFQGTPVLWLAMLGACWVISQLLPPKIWDNLCPTNPPKRNNFILLFSPTCLLLQNQQECHVLWDSSFRCRQSSSVDFSVTTRELAGRKKKKTQNKPHHQMKSSVANTSFPWAARLRKEAYKACDHPLGREQPSSERKKKTNNTELWFFSANPVPRHLCPEQKEMEPFWWFVSWVKGKICHKKDAGYPREFLPIIVHIVMVTQMNVDLVHSPNYLADVREKKGYAWCQEPHGVWYRGQKSFFPLCWFQRSKMCPYKKLFGTTKLGRIFQLVK